MVPPMTPGQLDRTERMARAVGRIRRDMTARVARVMETQGAPLVHWQLISAIAYEGLHSQAALATRVGMDPAGTSRSLDELERAGLVKRERDDEDRRRVSLALTTRGRRWYARVRDVVMGELSPMFEPLSVTQARQLETLLSRLADHSSGSSSDGSE
jgi:MarR family transcriptional regulator, lower aerobic nicotinate degradation pathway regulator